MRFNSIRFKASILYSVILAAILVLFGSVIYGSVYNILYHDLDEELKIKAEEVASILAAYERVERGRSHPIATMLDLLHSEYAAADRRMIVDDIWKSQLEVLNLKNDYINIMNARGQTLFSSHNYTADIARLFGPATPSDLTALHYRSFSDAALRLRMINLPVSLGQIRLTVQIGTSEDNIHSVLGRLGLFLTLAILVFLAGTSFVGSYFTRESLKPVREVVDMANRITHKDLGARIPEKTVDAEMHELIQSFNVMIKRLETSFGHVSEFNSHVAHELKTPLAVLRGEIELALDSEKTPAEYQKVLSDCLEVIDHMIKVVKDLLLLAKLDYRPDIFQFEDISLTALMDEIAEQSRILAEPKKIVITFDIPTEDIRVEADKVHLRRLFHNIIGNAIKYIAAGESVRVSLHRQGQTCRVVIADTGPGISEEDLRNIFRKFFRVPRADDTQESGTGLGLNIAQSIAKAHNGNINVTSTLGKGTTFTVELPVLT
ncbi:MAG: HAMP domain-containing protein [Candidatus Omnitrophica bacterium]|nr:HAMP domain-containing protein [Candidatus Omnitrophota bacterium]